MFKDSTLLLLSHLSPRIENENSTVARRHWWRWPWGIWVGRRGVHSAEICTACRRAESMLIVLTHLYYGKNTMGSLDWAEYRPDSTKQVVGLATTREVSCRTGS